MHHQSMTLYKLAGASINLAVDSVVRLRSTVEAFNPIKNYNLEGGPIRLTVTIFFGSIVLHLKAADYVLFRLNSGAIFLSRALSD